MWNKGNFMHYWQEWSSATTVENGMEILKIKNKTVKDRAISLLNSYLKKMKTLIWKDTHPCSLHYLQQPKYEKKNKSKCPLIDGMLEYVVNASS